MKVNKDILFTPIKAGSLTFKNRIGLAAMTRMRCDPKDSIPTPLLAEYYAQRASGGFILTECSQISNRSIAFPGAAGIFNDDQAKGWKNVVEAVHAKGGVIILQIWHAGRAAHSLLQNGLPIWGPSPIAIRGSQHVGPNEVPHEMTKDEIKQVINEFKLAAIRAKFAGFDGLELHGANGYIVDQFLRTGSNKRTDEYGGSVQNRSRFCLEVIDALIAVFGADRVGIKVSPIGRYNDMFDSDPIALYTYLFQELNKKGIAFIELNENHEPANYGDYGYPSSEEQVKDLYTPLRPHFKGVIIGNGDLTAESAAEGIAQNKFDAASFARLYVPNPDLVERTQHGHALAEMDGATLFGGNAKGYSDYPVFKA